MVEPMVVAVCGKGGAGKTSVSAAVVRVLLEDPGRRVLAVDADPAVGLAFALGLDREVTRTVDDLRTGALRELVGGDREARREVLARLDYELLEALVERDNLAFLAVGRPERQGCFCSVNDLLRDLVVTLARSFDAVVVDGEAGLEQVNRRVLEQVTHLLVVSDLSRRGLAVAATLRAVADRSVSFHRAGLVLNRVRDVDELTGLELPANLELLGWLPEDDRVRDADRRGANLLELAESPFFAAVRRICGSL